MSLQAVLTAQLVTGPATSGDAGFPTGVANFTFGLNPPQKSYEVDAGKVAKFNSPSAFVVLSGIGATEAVTQARLLYLRVIVPVEIRLTFQDPGGGADIVSVEPLEGVKLAEYPANGYLKLLEIKGSGSVEYYAAGPA